MSVLFGNLSPSARRYGANHFHNLLGTAATLEKRWGQPKEKRLRYQPENLSDQLRIQRKPKQEKGSEPEDSSKKPSKFNTLESRAWASGYSGKNKKARLEKARQK